MRVVLVLPKEIVWFGALYPGGACVTTLCKSWDICKPCSGAVGPLPGRAFEGSGKAVLPGLVGGWPAGLYLCPPLSSLS